MTTFKLQRGDPMIMESLPAALIIAGIAAEWNFAKCKGGTL